VGVGNLNTEGNALATIITLRHTTAPPICKVNQIKISSVINTRLDMIAEFCIKSKSFFAKILVFENIVAI
jgi:hypothetical protein